MGALVRESTQQLAQQPIHLSYSALNTLTSCGERYRLQRGLKISGVPSWAQVGGSAVHSMTEEYDRDPGEPCDFETHLHMAVNDQEERSGFPSSEFRATGRASKQYPNKEDRAWWLENGPIFVNNWVTWRQNSPWDLLVHEGTPAIEVEILLSDLGGVPNKMYVDRVFVTPDGELVVLDLKTGARKPPPFQLGQYKVGLEEGIGISPTWGTYWSARANTTSPAEDLSRFDREWLDELYWRGNQIITQGLFLPSPSLDCDWCDVRDWCRAYGGTDFHSALGVSLITNERI